jgi:adenine-specific DNA-methyltransferase
MGENIMNEHPDGDINQISGITPDFQTELAKKLQELVPEAICDGKVDTQKLKELLDKDTADESERFGLFWPGKKRAIRAAQEPTTATLKTAKNESKDWDTTQNIFIEGDNLEVLKIMQKHYHNKIKMIYIDPPYNTGKDFVYPDNFKEGLTSYLEFTKQVDGEGKKVSTNSDTDGRYHSNWLNMMYPRLKLARNLLTDDGVIFISIDDNEQDNLKKLCNEIFGENNFISTFIWKKKGTSTNVTGAQVSALTEYILAYSRGTTQSINSRIVSVEERVYPYSDEHGKYRTTGLEKKSTGDYNRESMKFEIIGHTPREGKRWQIGIDKARELELKGRFLYDNNIVKLKIYEFEDTDSYSANPNLLLDSGSTQSGQVELNNLMGDSLFDTPKPVALIKHIIKISSHKDSTILDFFSGSGTTAHAIMELNSEDGGNRHHIQVQLPEPTDQKSEAYKAGYMTIANIAKERIRRAGEKIVNDFKNKLSDRSDQLDIGFKVFKLTDSNFTKWQSDSDVNQDSLQQHLLDIRESSNDASSEEDLLTEVLLKQGISLTAKIEHQEISGLSVWNVGDTTVLAYLNEKIKPTIDQLRSIADSEPGKFIILEDAFHGDDELKTNLVQICKTNKIELWTV